MVDLYLRPSESRFVVNKDSNATLDYTWNWTAWLDAVSDTISAFTIIADDSITVESSALIGTKQVQAFISGGAVGIMGAATCRITTAGGRTDDRTIYFNIIER